jgi:hypothetical protein
MRLTVPLVALCLCLGACHHEEGGIADPLAPGAMGMVETTAGVETAAFTTLEIRGFPAAIDTSDDDAFRAIPTDYRASSQSILVDGVAFPLSFKVGAQGIGATDLPYYRVVAWLARIEGTLAPEPGAPWGTSVVALNDCSFGCESTCYCGVATWSADVLLSP